MKLRVSALAGILLAGLVAAVSVESQAEEGQYKVGDQVGALKATDLDGNEVTLESLKGKVVFLNFYALG